MHLPELITDLTLILCVASVVALLFRIFKLPLVLGYLLAGIFVGPHINLVPTVNDSKSIEVWAELGVIFLIFLLGLEFSFKKLLQVGKTAVIIALIEVPIMIATGFAIGKMLGWNTTSALFLGSIIAISSTTIIIKTYDELGIKTQAFVNIVFGVLVIEDLLAILILAILSTVGSTPSVDSGHSLGVKLFILLGIVFIAIPFGIWFFPRIFKFFRNYMNDEIRVILALALCLLFVLLSAYLDLSSALGAFLMGAFLAETSEGERTERFLKPISALFGAIFFTSIGMLVNIHELIENLPLIALLSAVVVCGKALAVSTGAMISGQTRTTALQTGFSMSQIGEFSFIIATLGISKNLISTKLYSIAVAVSIITTFTSPFLIQAALKLKLKRSATRKKSMEPRLWQGHLVEFEIHPHFTHAGSTLQELKLREKFGISIVELKRGHHKFLAPTREDRLMPYDQIKVLGTDAQLSALEEFLKSDRSANSSSNNDAFEVFHHTLKEKHSLIGNSIRNSGVREKKNCIILGIERANKKILNPDSTLTFEAADILWIYGTRDAWKEP